MKGVLPGAKLETPDIPDESDVLDTGDVVEGLGMHAWRGGRGLLVERMIRSMT